METPETEGSVPRLSAEEEDAVVQFMSEMNLTWRIALKFLLARDFDLAAAKDLIQRYKNVLTRHNIPPFTPHTTASLIHALKTPILYIPGTKDRTGATIMVFNVALMDWTTESGKRRMIRVLDYMCAKAMPSVPLLKAGLTLITNLTSLSKQQSIVEIHRTILELFQYSLPYRLNAMLVYNAPWWATRFPFMVKPAMSASGPLTTEVYVCSGCDLSPFVDAGSLPKELGGVLVYKHKEWIGDQLRLEYTSNPNSLVETDWDSYTARLLDSFNDGTLDSAS
ncbi:Tyrosine-protein phosphatase non-receptor type 9, partial [Quaeritorhiza haematococci]